MERKQTLIFEAATAYMRLHGSMDLDQAIKHVKISPYESLIAKENEGRRDETHDGNPM